MAVAVYNGTSAFTARIYDHNEMRNRRMAGSPPPESLDGGNPQLIVDRRGSAKLPSVLLIQDSADAHGVVKDTNVSLTVQQRFTASYRAAGGKIQLEMLPGAFHNFVNAAGRHLDHVLGLRGGRDVTFG